MKLFRSIPAAVVRSSLLLSSSQPAKGYRVTPTYGEYRIYGSNGYRGRLRPTGGTTTTVMVHALTTGRRTNTFIDPHVGKPDANAEQAIQTRKGGAGR